MTSEDAWDVDTGGGEYSWQGRGTSFDKMREEPSADGGMSKVALHCEELALSPILSVVQFDPSVLDVVKLVLVRSIPMHVSNDPRVLEIDEGVVNKEVTGR